MQFCNKIEIYSERIKEIYSACYIKHERDVFYIYSPGGIGQFNLEGRNQKSFSMIVPQLYKTIISAESEKIITAISESNLYVFDKRLKLIHHESEKPAFSYIIGDWLKLLYIDAQGNSFVKIVKLQAGILQEELDTELTFKKFTLGATNTLRLGVYLCKNMFSSNSFQSVAEGKTRELEQKKEEEISRRSSNAEVILKK